MAQQKTESMDKAVHCEIMRLLREGTKNPTLMWDQFESDPDGKFREGDLMQARYLLQQAEYFSPDGRITLAGMDYHRRETTQFRWARENWFPLSVAVIAFVGTVGQITIGILNLFN